MNPRQVFHLTPDQTRPLIEATDQETLNDLWQRLGIEMGFVWTTVADLDIPSGIIGEIAGTFTAETEATPIDPAFEAWFAQHFPDWKDGDSATETGQVIRSMTAAAFEAGRRVAAENLGGMSGIPASDYQITRLVECFDHFCPAGVPISGLSIDEMKSALDGITAAKDAGRRLFLSWAEPIIAEIERDDHSHQSSMALGAALTVMNAFIGPAMVECHRVIGTRSITELGEDGDA